jgi:serine/threonine protein kinase/Tfp pilus assembly protein PilF
MTARACSKELSACSAPALNRLTRQQQARLADVLDQYMRALERGLPLPQEALLEAHPDLTDSLGAYFRRLADLHDLAAGLSAISEPTEKPCPLGDEGRRLGDFDLLREIGRGGMGVVYEARQLSLDRRVAVKLLPFAAVLDAKQIARFKHEAQAAAQLHHPNIVPVFAIGMERGVHYYAMQLVDGQPLDAAIAELRDGSPSRNGAAATTSSCLSFAARNRKEFCQAVCRLGIQAAEALHAAHEYGVVHRDIKPLNLLLEGSGKLWVTDFGLARFRRDTGLTNSGDLVGTLRYMSPEQAAGRSERIDHRTDIYSLGATLYELACLRPAFPEREGPLLLQQIQRHDPPRPAKMRPGIPADLENVILKAMAKEPHDRYPTAQELADDLARALAGEPTIAKPLASYERLMKWGLRHRRLVGAGLVGLLLLSLGLATSTLLIARERNRTEVSAARAARHFREAREVLDRFGLTLSQELAAVPGAEHIRQSLLQETRDYYEQFIADAKDEPALRGDIALTFGKIASLLDEGESSEALATHEKAVAIFEELIEAEPRNSTHEQRLAVSQNNLALALRRVGRLDEAQQNLEAAIRRQRQLLARQRAEPTLYGELALSWSNLGLVQIERGQAAAAEMSFQAAIDLLKSRLAVEPDDAALKEKLAAAYNNLAGVFLNVQPRKAVELHQRALHLQVAAAASRPAEAGPRREVALTYSNLAAAYMRSQRLSDALESHGKAIAIQQELASQAPANALYQRDLVVSYNNLGLALSKTGKLDEATAMFRRACEIAETALSLRPDDAGMLSTLGSTCNNLAIVLEKANDTGAANEMFSKAIEHQRAAIRQAPEVARLPALLSQHQAHQARVFRQLGRDDRAIVAAQPANDP